MSSEWPKYYEDFVEGDISEFGAYQVTREEVLEFASKYDPQPFHLDDEAAKQSVFGRLAASGWHTCSISMRLIVDQMTETGTKSLGGAGIDELRWRVPVYPGDTLKVRIKIGKKSPHPRKPLGFVHLHHEVLNQDEVVVMSYIAQVMIGNTP